MDESICNITLKQVILQIGHFLGFNETCMILLGVNGSILHAAFSQWQPQLKLVLVIIIQGFICY